MRLLRRVLLACLLAAPGACTDDVVLASLPDAGDCAADECRDGEEEGGEEQDDEEEGDEEEGDEEEDGEEESP